ncbi:hypothetical protein [Streptomyces sp. NPDC048508]|uniref:MmyB family transcriptional regulator n=1 Tax=Streptomyces sp. NPDC048508 TaxID=3365561 RepID=UPI0037208986
MEGGSGHHCVDAARQSLRDAQDKELHDLIGELSSRSDASCTRWGTHRVRRHGSDTKRFHYHRAGDLTLTYEGMELTAEPGISLLIYTAPSGSPSRECVRPLANPAATSTATWSRTQRPTTTKER